MESIDSSRWLKCEAGKLEYQAYWLARAEKWYRCCDEFVDFDDFHFAFSFPRLRASLNFQRENVEIRTQKQTTETTIRCSVSSAQYELSIEVERWNFERISISTRTRASLQTSGIIFGTKTHGSKDFVEEDTVESRNTLHMAFLGLAMGADRQYAVDGRYADIVFVME